MDLRRVTDGGVSIEMDANNAQPWRCPRCGTTVPPAATTCPTCAYRQGDPVVPPPSASVSQGPAGAARGWSSWSTARRGAVVGGVLVVLLLAAAALAGPRRPSGPVVADATPSASPTFVVPSVAQVSTSPTSVPSLTPSPPPTPSPSPSASPTSPPIPSPTAEPTATQAPTPTATPEVPPASDFAEFYDGLWEVGIDIEPGTYRTLDYTSGCYWERLSGFSGDFEDIIANNFASGFQVVTIKDRDAGFSSDDCGDWTGDLSQVTESDTEFDEGIYIVGTDVRPGTYSADAGDGCYWARLKGFSGQFGDIIANDFRDSGQSIARIRPSDTGFSTQGCGAWTLR